MKRSFWRVLLIGFLGLSLVALAGCGSQGSALDTIKKRGKLIAGVKADVIGFGYKNPDTGQFEGLEIDIVKAIAKKILGDENAVEFVPVTAKTRTGLLNNGEIDLVAATFTVTEERKKEVDFSPVYYEDGIQLLVMKDSGILSLADMNGKTIGVAKGADTGERLMQKAKDLGITIQTAEFETYPEILAALRAGRVDAFATDGSILKSYQVQDPNTVLLPEKYSSEPYAIATKKGNDDLRQVVAQVVEELIQSGEMDQLIQKHGLSGGIDK
ncbi:MAG: transporter substrate-binding domain-containing protein [Clostridiales bacterium]|nr:transporter substrate-binding domain-containing protein [Clostridiales bacterium]